MLEIMLLIVIIGLNDALMVFIGAKIGQKVVRGQEIELPKIEPLKVVREYQESKEAQKEQEYYKTISDNIDNYDGTSIGQKELPR